MGTCGFFAEYEEKEKRGYWKSWEEDSFYVTMRAVDVYLCLIEYNTLMCCCYVRDVLSITSTRRKKSARKGTEKADPIF